MSNETKSIIGRQKLILNVSIQHNVVHAGDRVKIYVKVDNRSTMVVNFIKVVLRRIVRRVRFDSRGKSSMQIDCDKLVKEEYYQGGIFPLPAESNYNGEVELPIPRPLEPTNTYLKGEFEREYDVSVQLDIAMRKKNLKVRFPIIIDRDTR